MMGGERSPPVHESAASPGDPALPVTFAELTSLAENLRWTWHMDVRAFFAGLFDDASPGELEWPLRLLHEAGPANVEARLLERPWLADLARDVVEDRSDYLDDAPVTWYPTTHGMTPRMEIAYFSAEFALTDSLPIFAGGLGAIAGEQLKSSSALGVPLLGVGLLYKEWSHQWLDENGLQQEAWQLLDPSTLPVTPLCGADGRAVTVRVPFPGRDVVAKLWTAPVGRTWLHLLDTDVEENFASDRGITARLYGGDLETRIQQELVLGIGGLRALEALGHEPNVLHLNEGHTAFAALQHIASIQRRHGIGFDAARRAAGSQMIFTTHTPVNAGHDYFPRELATPYLEPLAEMLGIDLESLLRLGRYRPDDIDDTFCPTVLALRLTDSHNGVSRLHGSVTRQQWGGLWPRLPTDEVPIGHVTNGVHLQSWITPEIDRLLDRQLGEQWRRVPGAPESWATLLDADDTELWEASRAARERLVAATRARRIALLEHRSGGSVAPGEVDGLLDPDALTIGFVGRFVAYKRPTLFLSDPERFAKLLSDPRRPVQVVFAGKAHPNDEHGKRLLRSVTDFASSRGLQNRLVFIEDFDLTADRALAQGVDLWLNTPRRPLEACGIGGMKAGVNGALNLSTLDGWWDEVWNDAVPGAPTIGWCIGTAEDFVDHEAQDVRDAESLYERLERDIIPCFFDRDGDGLPRRWLASVRQSMATLAETWRSHRMVQQYVETRYVPSVERSARLLADGAAGSRRLAATIARIERAWPSVHVEVLGEHAATTGDTHVDIDAGLGGLDTSELSVDLWVVPHGSEGHAVRAELLGAVDGVARFRAYVDASSVPTTYAARAQPVIDDAPSRYLPGLIAWSS